jgi:hypothetical protein
MAAGAATGKKIPRSDLGYTYQRWTLDLVVALGSASAEIFRDNPNRFKGVSSSSADALGRFLYLAGHSPDYLSDGQRQLLLMPLLGPSDGASSGGPLESTFHTAADGVRQGACRFVERSFDTGERQLRNAFRDSVTTLQQYLTNIVGEVASDADRRVRNNFEEVVAVLQDGTFASGFGVAPAPGAPWPLDESFDGDGAQLVATIVSEAASEGVVLAPVSDAKFICVQRVAHYGSRAIDYVLEGSLLTDDSVADQAIGVAYQWKTALDELPGGAALPDDYYDEG